MTCRHSPKDEQTDIANAMEFLLSVTSRKTICFVVSDFLDEGFERALVSANRKHDVIGVLVTDPKEFDLPPVGLVALRDAETGAARVYDTASPAFRAQMRAAATERRRAAPGASQSVCAKNAAPNRPEPDSNR